MTPDLVFNSINLLALIIWLVLFIVPFSKLYNVLIRSGLVFVIFALAYSFIMISFFNADLGSLNSLDGIRALLDNEWAFVAGWIHYLSFDLLAGVWILNDSVKAGIKRAWIIVPLIFTFMAGPLGLLLYFIVKLASKRGVSMSVTE
jgi:hypothetical protein